MYKVVYMIDLESVVWAETCHELKDVLGFGKRCEMRFPPFGIEISAGKARADRTVLLLLINDASSYWYGQSDSLQAAPLALTAGLDQHEKWISFFFYNITSREDSERINKRND